MKASSKNMLKSSLNYIFDHRSYTVAGDKRGLVEFFFGIKLVQILSKNRANILNLFFLNSSGTPYQSFCMGPPCCAGKHVYLRRLEYFQSPSNPSSNKKAFTKMKRLQRNINIQIKKDSSRFVLNNH